MRVLALSERVLVVGASDGLWRSGDAGRTWQRTARFGAAVASEGLERAGTGVVADVSLVSDVPIGRTDGELYFSADGISWHRVTPEVRGFGDNHSLAYLTVIFDGTGADAHGVAFVINPDPVLNSGPLLHSSDGGRHWQDVVGLDQRNAAVQAVAFVPGTRTVYAAVDPRLNNQCEASLARSDDSGATWRPGLSGCAAEGISALSFVDGRHGFAAGDGLLVTADAGRSWTTRRVPQHLQAASGRYARLSFSSRSDGTVLAGACSATRDPQNEPCLGEVWVTANGGRAWRDTHVAALQVSSWGRTLIAAGGPGAPPGLSVSRDDGRSWSRVVAPGDIHVHQLTGPTGQLVALTNGITAVSSDGGRRWHRAPAQVPSVPYQGLAQAGTVVLRASFPNLQRSDDGGHTWRTVAFPGPNDGIQPGGIAFNRSDPTRAVVLVLDKSLHTMVLISSDSGRSWSRASTVTNTFDGTVSYDGRTIVFTAGRVEISHDDGKHFTRYAVSDGGFFLNSAGVVGDSVWVTGYLNNGLPTDQVLVAHSPDGGHIWTRQLLLRLAVNRFEAQLPEVLPLSGAQALLTMNTGALLRTTDAGQTWRQERPSLLTR
ncbi:hypothetical protein acdb102_46640 [Acidothermaceae bacterium B102]|nr:hypothetical protein acdb102_46640 [Acidothermaceae bacterium B102]